MTKEQAVEVLRCNTNLGYGIVIENESIQLIKEAIEMAIKALEQQPSDDCVSRQAVITIIQNHWWNCKDIDKLVKALPPVTPTHGTCKDCKNFCCPNGIMPTCKKCFRRVTGDFYCADFEKRGTENG